MKNARQPRTSDFHLNVFESDRRDALSSNVVKIEGRHSNLRYRQLKIKFRSVYVCEVTAFSTALCNSRSWRSEWAKAQFGKKSWTSLLPSTMEQMYWAGKMTTFFIKDISASYDFAVTENACYLLTSNHKVQEDATKRLYPIWYFPNKLPNIFFFSNLGKWLRGQQYSMKSLKIAT